jgi:hypothetical protein
MGIEPNADCLEATECTSFLLSPLEHFGTQPKLLSRRLRGEHLRERGHRPQESRGDLRAVVAPERPSELRPYREANSCECVSQKAMSAAA